MRLYMRLSARGRTARWCIAGKASCRTGPLRGEVEGIDDKTADAPGSDGRGATTGHVSGNVRLTGNESSRTRIPDDRGHPAGYAYRFDFHEGQAFDGDDLYFHTFKRALCVRR